MEGNDDTNETDDESSSGSEDSDSGSESSEDDSSYDEEARQKKDFAEAKRRAKAAEAALAWQPNPAIATASAASSSGKRTQGVPFSRLNDGTNRGRDGKWETQVGVLSEVDNSYEARFGEGGYGAKASAVLRTVRGKDFRHEKTKRKRGTYRGGIIDMSGGKSFKFAHSDDED